MDESSLEWLNALPESQATTELLKCCGSRAWAQQMVATRPFETAEHLRAKADDIWSSLEPGDWLEAFRSHPKIGEKKAEAPVSTEAHAWSDQEQSGIQDSATQTLSELARLNHAYEVKFGFIFIVCATGKSSVEMLSILKSRLKNDQATELRIAAAEQAKITEIRLRKLLA